MNREKAREYVTHKLAGELTDEEASELEKFLEENPDFAPEVERMEKVWKQLDRIESENIDAPPMREELKTRLGVSDDSDPKRMWWAFAAAAALIIVGVVLGWPRNGGPETNGGGAATGGKSTGEKMRETAQSADQSRLPRVLKARGLVMTRGPEDTRWRLLRRGDEIPLDHTVRIGSNPEFGVMLVSDDGTQITLAADSELKVSKSTIWDLNSGSAWVSVGEGFDRAGSGGGEEGELPPRRLHLRTPHGLIAPAGTKYAVRVSADYTLCRVRHGEVVLSPHNQSTTERVGEGQAGIIDNTGVRLPKTGGEELDALLALKTQLDTSQAVARLVARSKEEGEKLPLEIKSYDVKVDVVDGVARTFIDMVFINQTHSRMEGTFFYNLPPDAVISEFAMYVGERRVVGEVLERHRARQIFEYIRRERRDPALLEWVGGNLFKMRVYPIEPRSTKRIQLGYTQVLKRREGKVSYNFPLVSEMLKKNPLHNFSFNAHILSTPGLSDVECPSHRAQIETGDGGKRASVRVAAKDYTPKRDFHMSWRVPDSAECIVLSNSRPDEPEGYFMVQIDPRVRAHQRDVPARILLVLDGSASVDSRAFNIAREFARATCSMANGWEMNVVLTTAHADPLWADFQTVDWDTYADVEDFLSSRKPLGGTDLLQSFKGVADCVEKDEPVRVIYVGDGIDTLGGLEGTALVEAIKKEFAGKNAELSCVAVGSSYDREVLSGLAGALGGTFRAVQGATDVFDAADRVIAELYRPVLRDVKVEFEGVKVGAVYPRQIGTLAVGDTGTVLGRIVEGRAGKISVSGTSGGKAFTREYDIELAMPEEKNQFLPRLWAKAHMDALRARMGLGTKSPDSYLRDQIIAVSIDYQIMSPYTAFLVLESEEDYKKYGVVRRLRKVDWRGEMEGVSHRRPGTEVESGKPERQAPAGPVVPLPEPVPQFFSPGDSIIDEDETLIRKNLEYGAGGGGKLPGGERRRLWKERDEIRLEESGEAFSNLDLLTSWETTLDGNGRLYRDIPLESKESWGGDDYAEWSGAQSGFGPPVRSRLKPVRKPKELSLNEPVASGPAYWYASDRLGASEELMTMHEISDKERRVSGFGYYRRRRRKCYDYFRRYGINQITTKGDEKLKVRHWYRDELHARRAVIMKPENLQYRLDLVLALVCSGEYSSALKHLEGLEKSFGPNFHLLLERAWIETEMGNRTAAAESLQRAEKTLENVPEDKRVRFRQNLASQFQGIGQRDRAVEIYLDLAKNASSASSAINSYCTAWSCANSARDTAADKILEKMLERYPKNGYAYRQAAQYLRSSDPERALELLDRARELGQDVTDLRMRILFSKGDTEAAWGLLRTMFDEAESSEEVRQALQQARNYNQRRAYAWCRDAILAWEEPQLTGALQYARYNFTPGRDVVNKIQKMAESRELTDDHRVPVFNMLHRSSTRRREWAKILVPLLKPEFRDKEALPEMTASQRESIAQQRSLAFQALQLLINHGYYKLAEKHLAKFRNIEDLTESERHQLANARWQVERNSGNREEAIEHLEEAFRETKNGSYAYNHAYQLMNAFIEHGEYERAIGTGAEQMKRFPGHYNNRYLINSLYQRIRNMPELLDKARKLIVRGTSTDQERRAQRQRILALVGKGKFAEADAELRKLHDNLEKQLEDLGREVDELKSKIEKLQQNRPEKTVQPDGGGVKKETYQETMRSLQPKRQKLVQRRAELFQTLAWTRRLRAQVTARKAKLREEFLAECRRRAEDEDPVVREWTNAALYCLRAAGKPQKRKEMLEKLHELESDDPIWGRLLLNARIHAEEFREALKLAEKLRERAPGDLDLARTWYSLVGSVGDSEKIEAATNEFMDVLRAHPNTLKQMAQQWQNQKRYNLAIRAWLAVQKTPHYRANGNPRLQAASILHQTGKTKRATELLLDLIADISVASNSNYRQSAVGRLTDYIRDEESLRLVEDEVPALLEAEDLEVRRWSMLLAYRAANVRKETEKAQRLLNGMFALPSSSRYSTGFPTTMVNLLVEKERYKEAVSYARKGAEGLSAHNRMALLRNTASRLANSDKSRDLGIELYRDLIERGSSNVENDRRKLIECLTEAGRTEEAWEELEKLGVNSSDWNYWRGFRKILETEKDFDKAITRAIAAWRHQRQLQGSYRHSIWNTLTDHARSAIDKDKLSPDTRKQLKEVLMQHLRDVLSATPTSSYSGYEIQLARKLKVVDEVLKLAEEAAESKEPCRKLRAATCIKRFDEKNGHKRAAGIWRDVLQLKTTTPQQISSACSSLYSYYRYPKKDWAAAIEMLEVWKESGNLNEPSYLQNRVECLYKLNRRKEARAAAEKLLQRPEVRQNYSGYLGNLASYCQNARDHTMEVKVRKLQLQVLFLQSRRRNRSLDAGSAAQVYRALAQAYAGQGKIEEAVESCVRGLQIVNRNQHSWYYTRLRRSLIEILKGGVDGGVDAAVRFYEEKLLPEGEIPQLRVAFGMAYREANKEEKALEQLSIAAELLPKDTKLRRMVIQGYKNLDNPDEVEKAYLAWARLDPQNIQIYRELGQLYESQNRPDDAMKAYATMAEVRPREAEGHRAYGRILADKGELEEAIVQYVTARKYRPTAFDIARELAELYRRADRVQQIDELWEDGEKACRSAMEDLPDDPLPWLALARFLKAQGREDEAREQCHRILRRHWPRFGGETRSEARQILQTL
ncbi:MAG: VIT domain-containing protein [Candidatus Brocadiia bacterium]